jgi:hypothetical protein
LEILAKQHKNEKVGEERKYFYDFIVAFNRISNYTIKLSFYGFFSFSLCGANHATNKRYLQKIAEIPLPRVVVNIKFDTSSLNLFFSVKATHLIIV